MNNFDQSKINWSLAPDATHAGYSVDRAEVCFYKFKEPAGYYFMYESEVGTGWTSGHVSTPKHTPLFKKEITMDDLKDGMRVEVRGGDFYYVGGGHLLRRGGFEPIYMYRKDMSHSSDSYFDIVRVEDRDGTEVFQHKEHQTTEITYQQVADRFGVPIEKLRIKA